MSQSDISLPVTQEPSAWCRMLRTKAYFGTYVSGDEGWQEGDSSTATYWCLATMESAGPDEALAHPHQCRPERGCFEPPLD